MKGFSIHTCTFFMLWSIKHVRLWWRSLYKFNSRGSYSSDSFPNCSFRALLEFSFHFNSALYCLPLLSFKNSIFSALSESQLSLDIVFLSQSDTLPLLFWHIRHTMPSETIKCCCAPAAVICLYGNGLTMHCIAWYSVWSISALCTVIKTSHLHL